jgi:tRNA threonylcarbamoyladenosine biosynthesis protein TsaE
MVFESKSMNETKNFAIKFSKTIKMGKIIALNGDLGAGKTTFAQGFAIGMGIDEHVGSPTFKLVSEYQGDKMKLYHIDCYRLNGVDDFLNMGGENLLLPFDGISLFEWSSIISDVLPNNIIRVDFRRFKGLPNRRQLNIAMDN